MWYNADFNAEVIKFIQSFSSMPLDVFFQLVTMMGEEFFITASVTFIYWCINKDLGYRIGFICLSNVVINSGLKETLKVPRPIGEPGIRSLRIETASGYSFPSGHTQSAAAFFSSVMKDLKMKWFYALGSILIFLVAVSRLYLGVHRPVDVLAGIILGTVWTFITSYIFDISERTGRKEVLFLFILPMIFLLPHMPNAEYYKALGITIAFYAGYVIEPMFIKYRVKADFLSQVLKMVIGMTVLLGIKEGFKQLLPYGHMSDLFRYFSVGIWVTIGAPYVFKKFFSHKKAIFNTNVGKA